MPVLGPNGLPVRPQRQIPDEVLAHYLSDHEARLNALAAQNIHIGIMVEYMVQQLGQFIPDFDLDPEEFTEFRTRRFNEMKQEAQEVDELRRKAAVEQAAVDRGEIPASLDLSEIDDFDGDDEVDG